MIRSTLSSGLQCIVVPFVRFCLRHSITLQDLYSVLRVEFVRQARQDLKSRGVAETASKLSIMTGIPRKYINSAIKTVEKPEVFENLIVTVIGKWQTDSRFRGTSSKRPRPLSCEGNESDFAKLVRSISVDLNPYTVLNELERVKLVTRGNGKVNLDIPVYLEKDIVPAFKIGALDFDSLLRVIENNVGGQEAQHLHLSTFFDNIPDDALEEIRLWFLKAGSRFQAQARKFLTQYDRDSCGKKLSTIGRNTVRVTTFEFYQPTKGSMYEPNQKR